MKALLKTICLLFCFALPFAASAQAENQRVDLGSSTSIIVPADWQVTENENGYFTLEGDGFTNRPVTIEVMTPSYIRALGINFNDDRNINDMLIALTTLLDGVDLSRDEVQKTLYDDRAAASFPLTDDETTDTLNVALTLNDGSFAYLTVTVGNGQLIALNSQISEIIASFDTTRSAPTGDACTVRADTADSAQLRVGPGTNRGAISFLPVGADVTLSGDCANVGDTSAPPVIRAAPQNANPPAGDGSTTSTANATPAAGLLMPTGGMYTMTLAPVINASCEGTDNFPFSTSEYYEGVMDYNYYVEVVDANSFYFGEDLYRRYPGSNSFDGRMTYLDGTSSAARLDVVSSTQINGEENNLYIIDGFTCSATLLFTARLS